MKGSSKRKNAQPSKNAQFAADAQNDAGAARSAASSKCEDRSSEIEESERSTGVAEMRELARNGADPENWWLKALAQMIEVEFPGPAAGCGCDICREAEAVTVFEVMTDEESFVTDHATVACGIAAYLKRPVRIVSKRLPRVQFEAMRNA